MNNLSFLRVLRLVAAITPFLFTGCASYYTHYAVFPAENSAGQDRQVKLTWQTAEYPGWWLAENKSTPITVETQCSARQWRLVDDSHEDADSEACGQGIRACGEEGLDRIASTDEPAGGKRCMAINRGNPEARVTDIESSLDLLVACEPVNTTRGSGDEAENIDYIRASTVPYTIYSRRSPRGSLNARPPELDDSVCDDE